MNKKKILVVAMVICLAAIISMGSLAWFTDDDSVTNKFYIAGSDDQNPDDVFSIDVWEDDTEDDTNDEEKIQDGIEYPEILPGDDLYKEVNVENTGSYEQYVRVIVTVSDAHIWQDVNDMVYVPLKNIATDLSDKFLPWSIEFNADEDTLTYVLYYNGILPAEGDDTVTLFTNVHIPEALDRDQAAAMAGGFDIDVVAQAVQTKNVGANAAEAFETVGMKIEAGNSTIMTNAEGLKNALLSGALDTVTLNEAYDGTAINIDYDVADVTIDAANQNVALTFSGNVDNVTVTNIKDTENSAYPSVDVSNTVQGSSVTVKDSTLVATNGTGGAAIKTSRNCDITIDNCTFTDVDGKNYALYGFSGNNITVTNSTFDGFVGTWAMMINGTVDNNVVIDNCTFKDCTQGIFKGSVGGGNGNGLLNGDFNFTNNTLTNCAGHDSSEAKMFDAKVVGTITVSGNTRDGSVWTPGATNGIIQK